MNITEFAKSRNIQPQAVIRYISRHEKDFQGHVKKVGKTRVLDEVALQKLNVFYPLPKPIEVVEDVESIKKINALQEEIILLQRELNEANKVLVEAKAMRYILEDTQGKLEASEKALSKLEAENVRLANENALKEQELNTFEPSLFGFYRKKK